MSTPLPQLPIGQVIGHRYRIQSLIGRGGMGMVYAATHELTGRRVALKLVTPDSEEAPLLQERFLSEARIAAAVVHPNIVDVLDMGLHDGVLFLVMELLEGISLERLLEAQTRLSPEQTFTWLMPIMGALATLHDAGIVHRDVKPSNIFLSSLPRHPVRPKLLDFGLARVVSDLRLTRSGTVIGTPLYMAPEHASGHVAGPQADVWSIGIVAFECIAGTSPFTYTDRSSLAAQVLAGLVRPLSEVRPDLPPVLSSVIGRALQRDLGRRYTDMRAFAQALLAAGSACGINMPRDPDPIGLPDYQSWEARSGTVATTVEHHTTGNSNVAAQLSAERAPSGAEFTLSERKPRTGWLALGLLFVIAGAAYALWPRASAPLPAPIPTPAATLKEVEPALEKASVVPAPSERVQLGAPLEAKPDGSASVGSAASDAPRREPASPARRRATAERAKAVKPAGSAEKAPSKHVDEVESEWK